MTFRSLARLIAVLAALAPWPGHAQSVTVTSGEHGTFTRIALDFGEVIDWQVGRTIDGYALRIAGKAPDYDLSRVYKLIGRERISALWVDPENGDLHLGIGCGCYAMPFAFRPSIVVIDVKNGKPPKGSAFEIDLPGAGTPPEPPPAEAAQEDPAYDWVGARQAAIGMPPDGAQDAATAPLPVAEGLEPLRKALLEEMSRGAAAGLIDLTLPRSPTEGMVVGAPNARFSLGDAPNYATHLGETSDVPTSASGGYCLPDEALDMTHWALSDQPIADQMAPALAGIVGEFDKPDPEALATAVKFMLYLGFGTEARAMLGAFEVESAEVPVWTSLGLIMDDRPDTVGAFRTMAGCDTAAALWAVLSSEDLKHEQAVNTKAIVRAFSALPPHLRLLVGPRLADQLLSIDDALAARAVRDAVTRIPGEKSAEVTLLEAKLDVAQGDLTAAQARLAPLAGQSGPAAEDALAALVTATAEDLKPISPEQVDALAAIAQERRDGPDAARFDLAVTLGRAASDQFGESFEGLVEHPEAVGTVWSLLSVLGSDDDVAIWAVLPAGTAPPAAAGAAAARIAERLLGLGFAEQAAGWLAIAPDPDPQLLARVALARRDGTAVVQAVAGMDDPDLQGLKAEGLALTGNHRAAADLYHALGKDEGYWAAMALARDWTSLAGSGPTPWTEAAQALLSVPTAEPLPGETAPGQLATAKAIVVSADETEAAIEALLAAVPAPDAPTQ
jgi:hypothetical protein